MLTKQQIMKLVPKNKKAAIQDAWEDSDGIWIILNDGWNADNMDQVCQTIHEGYGDEETPETWPETLRQLKFQISGIRKV